MKRFIITAVLAVIASPVLAGDARIVPEMDGSAALAAITLLIGIGLVVREKMKK